MKNKKLLIGVGIVVLAGVIWYVNNNKNKNKDTTKKNLSGNDSRTASVPDACLKCKKEQNAHCNSGYSYVDDGFTVCKCAGCVGSGVLNQIPTQKD